MLGAQLCNRTVSGITAHTFMDQVDVTHSNSFLNSLDCYYSCRFSLQSLILKTTFKPKAASCSSSSSKSLLISCEHFHGRFDPKSRHDHDHEYLEASLLISETIKHYHLRRQGFQKEVHWPFSGQFLPLSAQTGDPRAGISSLGMGFFRRFKSPTIFLKISCEGEFLMPIVVGEFAVEKLIESLQQDDGDCPNEYQFVRNLADKLGYEVKMVKITERVANTYFARVCFSKVGEKSSFSVDARPSDAINVARRCKAPIYVNKQIVLTDAIRISYGSGRLHNTRPIYDVSLDSAPESPDLLTEELDLVRNMNLAVERGKNRSLTRFLRTVGRLNLRWLTR
ncbi:hypothetical protein Nepgr_016765 [Nepenthes gracilis]|uniref:BFN domain-containing protein n=1 Tax=Nepenthes gracilis TaxID=150966 RepID=A0AAD3XSF6_NEPGR|nr:hypothetical protein Nepgr_016765 [Nepenthes gracilis]